MSDKLYHRRHHDWEMFDEIRIKIVPRYKTSGLSGDEWRVSAVVECRFKGAVVMSRSYSTMESAIRHLGAYTDPDVIPDGVIDLEKTTCDQPGCSNLAVSQYKFKKTYERGQELVPNTLKYYAKFCEKHLRRGDCGFEDSDANYEVVQGPGPDGSTNTEESPSVFGGVFELRKKTNED